MVQCKSCRKWQHRKCSGLQQSHEGFVAEEKYVYEQFEGTAPAGSQADSDVDRNQDSAYIPIDGSETETNVTDDKDEDDGSADCSEAEEVEGGEDGREDESVEGNKSDDESPPIILGDEDSETDEDEAEPVDDEVELAAFVEVDETDVESNADYEDQTSTGADDALSSFESEAEQSKNSEEADDGGSVTDSDASSSSNCSQSENDAVRWILYTQHESIHLEVRKERVDERAVHSGVTTRLEK